MQLYIVSSIFIKLFYLTLKVVQIKWFAYQPRESGTNKQYIYILTAKEKRAKHQEVLSAEETIEMLAFLAEKRSNHSALAGALGVTSAAVSYWKSNKKFPKYCGLFLEKLRLKEFLNLTGEKK